MRLTSALLASCVAVLVPMAAAQAGPNADAFLPMHAIVATGTPSPACSIPDPCVPGPPLVNVPLGSNIGVYLLIRNYDNVAGVQTAFDWGDWTFLMGTWSCQANQLSAVAPHGSGGPTEGTIATAFDCITGGDTEVIGFMRFVATTTGCLTQVESSYPQGTHVIDCLAAPEPVVELNRGTICVDQGGLDACEPTVFTDGLNANVTLPLHAAIETELPPFCDIGDPCDPGPPLVNIPLNSTAATYLMARGYTALGGVQTAFDWGDWEFISGSWGCQPGQVASVEPHGNGGPLEGTLATSFDCILGGQTVVLGSMLFLADVPGCVTQVESAHPGGTRFLDCNLLQSDPVPPERRGSICVGQGGVDACGVVVPQPPICDAGGPYSGQIGETIQFDGSGSSDPDGTIVAYDWDFGDGATGTGVMPTHSYSNLGTYFVALTVTDNDGFSSSCSTTANIAPNFPPICEAGGPYLGIVGEPVQFDGSGSIDPDGTIVAYDWQFGDGATGTGVMPTHTYMGEGLFSVTLTVTDDGQAQSSCETTAEIFVDNIPPICDANGPYVQRVGVPVQFDGSGSSAPGGTIVAYDWEFGDGATGTGVAPEHAYAVTGLYTVTLTVTDDNAASSSCSTTAEIFENFPPFCDAGGPYFGDEGVPLQFDGSGSNDPDGMIVAYDWDFGDGSTGTGVTPTHTYVLSGSYIATLCVTDNDGAASCCDAEVDVSGPSPVAFAGFEAVSMAGGVHLSWRTSLEFRHALFNVYRRDPGTLDYAKVNDVWLETTGADGTMGRYVDGSVIIGETYEYRIELMDPRGAQEISQPVRVTVTRDADARPVLRQNRPNPFNPFTTITFMVPEVSSVKLAIFDTRGRLVRTLVDEALDAGIHLADWDGRDQSGQTVSSGVYIYRLDVGSVNLSKRMVLVR